MITLITVSSPSVFRCRRRGSRLLKSSAPPRRIDTRVRNTRARLDRPFVRACAPEAAFDGRCRSASQPFAQPPGRRETRRCRSCGCRFKDGSVAAARSSCRVDLRRVTRPSRTAEPPEPDEAGDRATPGRQRRRHIWIRTRSRVRYYGGLHLAPPDDDLTSRACVRASVCVCVRRVRYHELSSDTQRCLQCGRSLLRGRLRRGNILYRKWPRDPSAMIARRHGASLAIGQRRRRRRNFIRDRKSRYALSRYGSQLIE